MRLNRKSNTIRGRTGWGIILICLSLIVPTSTAGAQDLAQLLPADVRQFASFREPEKLRNQWNATSLGVGWNSAAMAPFHQARREDTGESIYRVWEVFTQCEPLELAWAELAVVENHPQGPGDSLVIASFPKEIKASDVFAMLRPKLSNLGFEFVTRVEKDPPVIELRDRDRRSLFLGNVGTLWMVTKSANTLTRLFSARPETKKLTTNEAFTTSLDKLPRLEGRPGLLWYVDSQWIQSQDAVSTQADSGENVVQALWLQSRTCIRGVTAVTHLDEDSRNWVSDLHISTRERPQGILGLARFTSGLVTEIPSLSKGASATFAAHWDTSAALAGLGSIFDQIYADGIEGTFEDVLVDLKETEEINIDLPAAVAKLGPRASMNVKVAPEANEWTLSVSSSDPPQTADVVTRLFDGDAQMKPLPNLTTGHGWQLQAEEDPLDGSVLQISGDQLTFASSILALEKLLPGPSGGDDMEINTPTGKLKPAFSGVFRWGDFLEPWWDDQRKSAIEKPGQDSSAPPYSKLPAFAEVAEHFGLVTIQVEDLADGWLVRATHLSPHAPHE